MKKTMLCLGLGYSAEAVARRLYASGWRIRGTSRDEARRERLAALGFEVHPFDRETPLPDAAFDDVDAVLASAAPDAEGDPAMDVHGTQLCALAPGTWVGYLSSTSVYGDHDGAWVDEESPLLATSDRGLRRIRAERLWLDLPTAAHVFRLAGIYGPGRNVLERVRAGRARRIVKPGQHFSRIHVDDIAATVLASLRAPAPGTVYNVADDAPAPGSDVVAYAAELLGVAPPPEVAFEDADLSPAARLFYADDRKVLNRRLRERLGVTLRYSTYREGLASLLGSDARPPPRP